MRTPYIAGNWKMNTVPSQAVELAKSVLSGMKDPDVKVMIAPPFVCLPAVAQAVRGSKLVVAAQNVNDHESGAYTGEVSCSMLKDIGVGTVIIGHSERRLIFGESDELINRKVLFALENGMDVVLCIGETLLQRESGMLEAVLRKQVETGLNGVDALQMKKITLAYEPVWAIGTGKTATPQDADKAHAFVRSLLASKYSDEVAENTVIQYGGSVKPSNIGELMSMKNIDGALVGGASLTAEQFLPIINFNL